MLTNEPLLQSVTNTKKKSQVNVSCQLENKTSTD